MSQTREGEFAVVRHAFETKLGCAPDGAAENLLRDRGRRTPGENDADYKAVARNVSASHQVFHLDENVRPEPTRRR